MITLKSNRNTDDATAIFIFSSNKKTNALEFTLFWILNICSIFLYKILVAITQMFAKNVYLSNIRHYHFM